MAARETGSGGKQLIGYVVADRSEPAVGADELVDQWRRVYDDLYSGAGPAALRRRGFRRRLRVEQQLHRGTDSGRPDARMADTTRRAHSGPAPATGARDRRRLGPADVTVGPGLRRVLGDGLFRGHHRELERQLRELGADWTGRVTLSMQAADDPDGLPRKHFDTVILNSVIQYFPGQDYLREVLEQMRRSCWFPAARYSSATCGISRCWRSSRPRSGSRVTARRPGGDLRAGPPGHARPNRNCCWRPSTSWDYVAGNGIRCGRHSVAAGHAINELTRYRYDVVLRTAAADPYSAACLPQRISATTIGCALSCGAHHRRDSSHRHTHAGLSGHERPKHSVGAAGHHGHRAHGAGLLPEDLHRWVSGPATRRRSPGRPSRTGWTRYSSIRQPPPAGR